MRDLLRKSDWVDLYSVVTTRIALLNEPPSDGDGVGPSSYRTALHCRDVRLVCISSYVRWSGSRRPGPQATVPSSPIPSARRPSPVLSLNTACGPKATPKPSRTNDTVSTPVPGTGIRPTTSLPRLPFSGAVGSCRPLVCTHPFEARPRGFDHVSVPGVAPAFDLGLERSTSKSNLGRKAWKTRGLGIQLEDVYWPMRTAGCVYGQIRPSSRSHVEPDDGFCETASIFADSRDSLRAPSSSPLLDIAGRFTGIPANIAPNHNVTYTM